jgi:hypothetical protein
MHPRGTSAALLLALLILTMGLAAGCGGGDQSGNQSGDESGNGSQNGGSDGAQKQGGEGAPQGVPRPKVALGTVVKIDTEKSRITLRPSTEEQGERPIPFKVKPKATITLNDQAAELADAKKGQQAQITYIVRNERNLAREVSLISGDGGGGEGTG